jgi:phosphomannomutase
LAVSADLSQLVKAYDVRGVVPDQWDESLAELFGAAFVQVTGASAIVTGHDMRPSSPACPPPSRAGRRHAAST